MPRCQNFHRSASFWCRNHRFPWRASRRGTLALLRPALHSAYVPPFVTALHVPTCVQLHILHSVPFGLHGPGGPNALRRQLPCPLISSAHAPGHPGEHTAFFPGQLDGASPGFSRAGWSPCYLIAYYLIWIFYSLLPYFDHCIHFGRVNTPHGRCRSNHV